MAWKCYSFRETGLNKKSKGKPCQDYVFTKETADGGYIAAIADGVGFFEYSQIAAKAAVESVVSWVEETKDFLFVQSYKEHMKRKIISQVQREIEKAAVANDRPIEKMDCNLAFVYVRPDLKKVFIGQLGDNAVCILDSKPRIYTSANGTANLTESVRGSRAVDNLLTDVIPLRNNEPMTIVLTTDGLDGFVYRKSSQWIYKDTEILINPLVSGDAAYAEAMAKKTISSLVGEYGAQFDDDISFAVLTNAEQPLNLLEDPVWHCTCGAINSCHVNLCPYCGREFVDVFEGYDIRSYGDVEHFLYNLDLRKKGRAELPPVKQENSEKRTALSQVLSQIEKQGTDLTGAQKETSNSGAVGREKDSGQPGDNQKKKPLRTQLVGESNKVQNRDRYLQEKINQDVASDQRARKNADESTSVPQEDASPKNKKFKKFIPWVIAVLTTILFLLSAFCIVQLKKDSPNRGLATPTAPYGEQVDGQWLKEREADAYIGPAKEGRPHGKGTLYFGDNCWYGNFDMGIKNGVFVIYNPNIPGDYKAAYYKDDVESAVLYMEPEFQCKKTPVIAINANVKLRELANYGAPYVSDYKTEDILYILDEKTVDNIQWSLVISERGVVGWCEKNNLVEVER